jgi:hypothetical protein
VPLAGGGSNPERASITGTLVGAILGLLFIIAACVAIWIFVIGRRGREIQQDAGEQYETEVETQGEFSFEADEQYESCDGGTNFDQDDNQFIEQGFEAGLYGNAAEETAFQF